MRWFVDVVLWYCTVCTCTVLHCTVSSIGQPVPHEIGTEASMTPRDSTCTAQRLQQLLRTEDIDIIRISFYAPYPQLGTLTQGSVYTPIDILPMDAEDMRALDSDGSEVRW